MICAESRGGDGDGDGEAEAGGGGGGDGDEDESSRSGSGTAESLKCGVWRGAGAGAVGFGPEGRSDGADVCQEVPLSQCWNSAQRQWPLRGLRRAETAAQPTGSASAQQLQWNSHPHTTHRELDLWTGLVELWTAATTTTTATMDDQSLNSKASSLLELDPTPIDSGSPNTSDKALPPLPLPDQIDGAPSDSPSTPPNSSSTPAALGLSGTGHGAIYYRPHRPSSHQKRKKKKKTDTTPSQ